MERNVCCFRAKTLYNRSIFYIERYDDDDDDNDEKKNFNTLIFVIAV